MNPTEKTDRILVPLDGSDVAERALPFAAELAAKGAAVDLVHVHVPLSPDPIHVEGLPVIDEHMRSLRHDHERAYMERMRERLGSAIAAHVVLLDGRPAAALAAHARSAGAGLIVMTTHGRGGFERAWLGSVADELARVSAVPLLVVRPEPGSGSVRIGRLLVPLDGSRTSEAILEHAQRLTAVADGAEIVLFTVVRPLVAAAWLPEGALAVAATEDDLPGRERRAREYLESVARSLPVTSTRVRTRVATASSVASAILQAAEEEHADVIALATHGRSGLARLTLGSVADKVLRGSRLPVLLFRPSTG